jgi:hypothetical protein
MSKQIYAWKEQWYWFSFSYKGKNQGCCMVQAHTVEEAMQKTIDLNIHPKHDNIAKFLLTDEEAVNEQSLMKPDRLYKPEELLKLGYQKIEDEKDHLLLEKLRLK